MTRAVIYCRCSTEEESQRDALMRQAAEARDCVSRLNWFLADQYIESRSGTSTKGRTQYQRLYADLLLDKFDVVVIKSQDRLMRNTRDWYIFIERLVSCGKKLYLYLENKFYSADDGLLTGIKAILAEEYSRELSKKINNAHKNRQKTGSALMLTSHTYGYRKQPDGTFVLKEEEAKVKRQMYELCASGLGSRQISRILRENGIHKRNGNYFSDSDIRRMIRNPMNKGTIVMNRRHYDFDTKRTVKIPEKEHYVYENRIPAIVSSELWKKANDAIDERGGGKRKAKEGPDEGKNEKRAGKNPGKYALSGKLVCGQCGALYYRTVRTRKNKKVVEWKCRTYLEQGRKQPGKADGCDNRGIKEDWLFEKLFSREHEEELEKKQIRDFMRLFGEMRRERNKETAEEKKTDLEKIKEQQRRLLDLYLEGEVSEILYRQKYKELEENLKAGEQDCERTDWKNGGKKKEKEERDLEEAEKFLTDRHIWKKACVLCMLEEAECVVVYPQCLKVSLRGNFFSCYTDE